MAFWPWQYLKSAGNNFGSVTDHIYRSSQPSSARLHELATTYKVRVNLNLRNDLGQEERDEVYSAGMDFFNIEMRDDRPPSLSDVKLVLSILNRGPVILVCCKGGRHRTGLVIAVYRVVVDRWTKKDAWAECEKFGWYDHGGHKTLRLWFEELSTPYIEMLR